MGTLAGFDLDPRPMKSLLLTSIGGVISKHKSVHKCTHVYRRQAVTNTSGTITWMLMSLAMPWLGGEF